MEKSCAGCKDNGAVVNRIPNQCYRCSRNYADLYEHVGQLLDTDLAGEQIYCPKPKECAEIIPPAVKTDGYLATEPSSPVCEHDWVIGKNGTKLWCRKCKFLSSGHSENEDPVAFVIPTATDMYYLKDIGPWERLERLLKYLVKELEELKK